MNSVKTIQKLFDASLRRDGVIDADAQARALAIASADGTLTPTEVQTLSDYVVKHAANFEEAVRFRNRFAGLANQRTSRNARPVRSAVDVRVSQSLGFNDGFLALTARHGERTSSVHEEFVLPGHVQRIKDGHSVLVPLQARKLHVIELEYQDTRRLADLEFNFTDRSTGKSGTFRGGDWFAMVEREARGEIRIEREPDHKAPWVNNPVMVRVEVVYPGGRVHHVGDKYLDFHVHDATDANSSGYSEIDNISNGYENLPKGKLPEGCFLRLSPYFADKQPWETRRKVAAELFWVRPTYLPKFAEREVIYDVQSFRPTKARGYAVDPNRPIAGLLVTWTDKGGMADGNARFRTADGEFVSEASNVGSGETELIPCNNQRATDGRIFIEGEGVSVQNIEVLYGS